MPFRKAEPKAIALKMLLYGRQGSGKTLTSLLLAEGLAQRENKRIAYIDTERGTNFYALNIKERAIHPAAFDFDLLSTRSLTEATTEIKKLKPTEHCVIVIDSITHLWESAIQAYSGNQTRAGTIPIFAWSKIKKPYKDLLTFLINSPMHVILCSREGNEYDTDDDTGEMRKGSSKPRAEKDTAHEPHIVIQMEGVKADRKTGAPGKVIAFAEKDRTGILTGRIYENPTFDMLRDLAPILGHECGDIQTIDESAAIDSEGLAVQDSERAKASEKTLREMTAKIDLCTSLADIEKVGKTITPDLKKRMTAHDVAALRKHYLQALEGSRGNL